MLSSKEILERHFGEALALVNHLEIEKTWRELAIQSCIPTGLLHELMQDERLRDENYVKSTYAEKIKKCVKKIEKVQTNLFI